MLINLEYNLIEFGSMMYDIRKKNKYTQSQIRNICGLNPDTIRKIESGLSLPNTDTIIKLSEIYKIDVNSILENCRYQNCEIVREIKAQIDFASYADDTHLLVNITELMTQVKDLSQKNSIPTLDLIILQLDLLCEILSLKNKADILNASHSSDLCYKALRLTHSKLDKKALTTGVFTPIEIRFLIALSYAKSRMNETIFATEICLNVINNLKIHCEYEENHYGFLLQAYYTLAHFYFLLNMNPETIRTCDVAIQLSIDKFNMKFLPHLYYRKGVAEFLLNAPNYSISLKKSFDLFDLLNQTKLKDHCITILKNRYQLEPSDYI